MKEIKDDTQQMERYAMFLRSNIVKTLYTQRSLKIQFSTVVKSTDCEARYSPCLGFLICKNEEIVVFLTLRIALKIKIISANKRKRLKKKKEKG